MNHKDTDKRFDKEIIDYFWNKESVVGTQRLSMNHIEKIKSFIHQEIERAVAEREKYIKGKPCPFCGEIRLD